MESPVHPAVGFGFGVGVGGGRQQTWPKLGMTPVVVSEVLHVLPQTGSPHVPLQPLAHNPIGVFTIG